VKKNLNYIIHFLICAGLLACNNKANELSKKVERSKLTFEYFSSKANVHVVQDSIDIKATLYLKMHRDNVIWASISKLGKEAMRVKLTPDTTWYMNKYPDKYYSVFLTQDYLKETGVDVEFGAVQDIFLGIHPLEITKKDEIVTEGDTLFLVQERNGTVIESKLLSFTSRLVYSKISSITDTVIVQFKEYQNIQGKLMPTQLVYDISAQKEDQSMANVHVEVNYTKPKFLTEEPSFTFRIPDSYELR